MGGFHGGHSSGGHSSGGHSTGGSHGGGYHGGGYHAHYGRGYYGYSGYHYAYASSCGRNRKNPPIVNLIAGIILTLVGCGIFLLFFRFQSTATITNVKLVEFITERYWKYNFSYSWCGKTYNGYGDDDYYSSSDFAIGDQYPVYFTLLNPSDYKFENGSNYIVGFSSGLFAIGGLGFISAAIVGFLPKKADVYIGSSVDTKSEEETKKDDEYGDLEF